MNPISLISSHPMMEPVADPEKLLYQPNKKNRNGQILTRPVSRQEVMPHLTAKIIDPPRYVSTHGQPFP